MSTRLRGGVLRFDQTARACGRIAVRHAARPRLLCIATILMYPMMLDACRQGWPQNEEQTDALDAFDASFWSDCRACRRLRMAHGGATSGGAGGQAQRGPAQLVLRSAICRAAERRVRAGRTQD